MSHIKTIIQSPLVKNTLKLSSSNVLMYFLPLVVTPILSRLYEPEAFGEWGIFSSVLTIAGIAIALGYDNAIVKVRTDSEALNVSVLCIVAALVCILLLTIVFIAGSYLGIAFFKDFPHLPLLVVCLLMSPIYNVLSNLSNRFERYTLMSTASIVLGGSQAAFRILFGTWIVVAINGLILGTTIAQLVNILFMLVCLYPLLRKQDWKSIGVENIRRVASENKLFALYDAPASLLSFAAFNLPIIILSLYYHKAEIGCYSIIIQLLLMPMSFIGSAMGRVYYKQISENMDSNEKVRHITTQVVKVTSLISIMPLLFLAVGGDKIVVLFLGEKWGNAGNMALCLALWSLLTILTQPLMPLLRLKDRQSDLLRCNLLYFVLGIGAIITMASLGCGLLPTLLVYAIACCIAKAALFGLIMRNASISLAAIPSYTKVLMALAMTLLAVRIGMVL